MKGTKCLGQSSLQCQADVSEIQREYEMGEWSNARDLAWGVLNRLPIGFKKPVQDSARYKLSDCMGGISKVYEYLFKSLYRLGELDSANAVHVNAIKNGISFSMDNFAAFDYLSKVHVEMSTVELYGGMTTTGVGLGYRVAFHYNFGSPLLFGEICFDNRHFDHVSNLRSALFGVPLKNPVGSFPQYGFNISGSERFVDLYFGAHAPLFQDLRYTVSLLDGMYVSYYLNSNVDAYQINIYNSATDTVSYAAKTSGHRLMQVPELHMDLTSLYSNRVSFGVMFGLQGDLRCKNGYQLFLLAEYTAGTNFVYAYKPFSSYQAGVGFLSLNFGVQKTWFKVRKRRRIY